MMSPLRCTAPLMLALLLLPLAAAQQLQQVNSTQQQPVLVRDGPGLKQELERLVAAGVSGTITLAPVILVVPRLNACCPLGLAPPRQAPTHSAHRDRACMAKRRPQCLHGHTF